jgi:prepilin-type N-terminal cleavage/methylation domain-containing protein
MLLETEMTISECLRRDPQKGKKEFSTHKGFTVIELMITVAVIAIITSLALPSYRTLIEKRQITSSSTQLAAFLSAAKMEAVKRNQKVAVASKTAESWCLGLVSYAANASSESSCDCTKTVDEAGSCSLQNLDGSPPELRVFDGSQMEDLAKFEGILLGGTDDVVVFDPVRGMLVTDDVVDRPLEVRLTSKYDTYALNVRVSATGRVTVCSDHQSRGEIVVPGYDDC